MTELTEELKETIIVILSGWLNYGMPDHRSEKVEAALDWIEKQEIPHPLHVSKEACPYCNRFTTVWRTGDSGQINIRRCENCYNHFVYFTQHPEHGTQVVTEEAFHNMLHQPGPRSFHGD